MLLVTATGAGCQFTPDAGAAAHRTADVSATPAASSPTASSSATAPAPAAAADQLAALRVQPETDATTYRRAAYGARWADVNHTGCNTRDQLLYSEAAPGTVRTAQQGRCPNDVLAGTWTDFYTGQTLTFDDLKDSRQAQAVTLDHLVALAEADRSGASSWPADRKERFANDSANLRVTAGTVNSAKGDRDPATWQPPTAARCGYATAYVGVKTAWQLAVDQAEHDALSKLLAGCPPS